MDDVQAEAILSLVAAYFPVPQMSMTTRMAWREAVAPLQQEYALPAIKALGREGMPLGKPFHISELVKRTEEFRRAADQGRFDYDDRSAFDAIVPASEDEKRSILARYWEHVGMDRRLSAEAARGRRVNADGVSRIEAIRERTRLRLEGVVSAQDGAEDPPRVIDPRGVMTTACGAPAGAYAVVRTDGVPVCPNCESPVADGCRRPSIDDDEEA